MSFFLAELAQIGLRFVAQILTMLWVIFLLWAFSWLLFF